MIVHLGIDEELIVIENGRHLATIKVVDNAGTYKANSDDWYGIEITQGKDTQEHHTLGSSTFFLRHDE
jgi:hypothetical protein